MTSVNDVRDSEGSPADDSVAPIRASWWRRFVALLQLHILESQYPWMFHGDKWPWQAPAD